jgi:hypothetical protein
LIVFICVGIFLSGCYPSIKGVLLDTDANTPIQGATIQLENDPKTKTVTDCNGIFKTKSYIDLWFILPIDIFEFHFEIYHADYGFQNKKIFTKEIYCYRGVVPIHIRKDSNGVK